MLTQRLNSKFIKDATLEDPSNNYSWLTCAGALEHLVKNLEKALALSLQVKTSNEINPKEFITHAVKISASIKEHAAALQLSSQNALSRYEEAIGDLQENQETEQSFLLPDWDPGLRSSKLSDNQKRYLIKKDPHQPTLANFHKRTAYQFLNSGNSPPIGI